MKILKGILFALLILIALPLIVALLVKKDYAVEREITIEAPKEMVFDYLRYLKNQDNFSVWSEIDPDMRKTFSGTDGTVGFVSAWESDDKNVGKGEQEIMKITEGERIDYELRFYVPFETTDQAYMTTQNIDGGQTLVRWGFNGKFDYPMNIFLLVMDMDRMLGPDLESGLIKLKDIMEKAAVEQKEAEMMEGEAEEILD
jgi:uncharacterized protein YndB with AHSA1/START domain